MDEAQYIPWAEKMSSLLEDGQADLVFEELDPEETYTNCVNLPHYISVHWDYINYPEYKVKGYFCGSGAIESGNKIVLQKRLKQAGMRWGPQIVQYLLTLKTKHESGRWEQDVVDFIKAHLCFLKQ